VTLPAAFLGEGEGLRALAERAIASFRSVVHGVDFCSKVSRRRFLSIWLDLLMFRIHRISGSARAARVRRPLLRHVVRVHLHDARGHLRQGRPP
jgi:hypothetical protein